MNRTIAFRGIITVLLSILLASSSQGQGDGGAASASTLIINYHRFDGDYQGAGLWTWDGREQRNPANQEVLPAAETDYGVRFEIDPAAYGNDDARGERIGFIPRLRHSWDYKDGSDRYWTPDMGNEIWLIGNDPQIYTTRPDTSPHLAKATLDGRRLVTLVLTHPAEAASAKASLVTLATESGQAVPVAEAALVAATPNLLEVTTAQDLDPAESYTATLEGLGTAAVVLGRILDDRDLFYADMPLGALYTPERTTFRLFAPNATAAHVILYDNATGNEGRAELALQPIGHNIWEAGVDEDLQGRHYMFRTDTRLFGRGREAWDPYAVNTTGNDGHPRITDLRATDPEGFRPIQRPQWGNSLADAIIYEMHVRDFTVDASSGAVNRGKYLGFTETNTHLPGHPEIATGIAHLKELGVTHLQLMPPFDAHNDESKFGYNWGYMTAAFFSPEGIYSTDIRTDARVRELKQLVKALHDAGIAVIFDVVYNHTSPGNPFEELAPGYYHRMKEDGSFWNGSGTGNEFRSEAPMARKFIVDSCKFWVEEYGVDGFRFDLMGLVDLETMKEIQREVKALYPNALVYGEPWTGGQAGIAQITDKNRIKGTGIGAFNDALRDAIKGSTRGTDGGYVQNGSRRDDVKRGIAGSMELWTSDPLQALNYVSAHDDMTLWDKLAHSAPTATPAERARMQRLAHAICAVSQGGWFLHGGAEMMRTKDMVENSYNADDSINSIDWNWKREHRETVEYVKGLIALRKAHPAFRLETAGEVRARLAFHDAALPDPRCIVFTINGEGLAGESWNRLAVLVNPTEEDLTFPLPFGEMEGEVSLYVHDTAASVSPLATAKAMELRVPARSLSVIAPGK
ncbi:MAG: pullulanase [Candidatus Sumerlaeota bacterium]|nr:pullulanase [Candidatus Sumerlaeota bacterium]